MRSWPVPPKPIDAVRAALREIANPDKAPPMAAYMKSEMPFHGAPKPAREKALKPVLAAIPLPDAPTFRRAVLSLWRDASFREERYAALTLSRDKRAKGYQDMDALPMYEEMITTGAWWDYVDELASHGLGAILAQHPREMKRAMLAWSRDPNLWKRRSSILCQLQFKGKTDLDLLYACIEPSVGSTEFFLRKAIGWALRQYAWTDPKEITRWVSQNEHRLSGLTKREALKNIAKAR